MGGKIFKRVEGGGKGDVTERSDFRRILTPGSFYYVDK